MELLTLSVLVHNFKRIICILGFERTKKAIRLLGPRARQRQPRALVSEQVIGYRDGLRYKVSTLFHVLQPLLKDWGIRGWLGARQ